MFKRNVEIKIIIKKLVEELNKELTVDKVILFGSYANGKSHRYSDIDLAVVSEDFKKYNFEKLANIFSRIRSKCDSRIELHHFSRDQVKQARPTNFFGYILNTGKIVYSAS